MDHEEALPLAKFDTSEVAGRSRFEAHRAHADPFLYLHQTEASFRDPDATSTTYLMHGILVNVNSFGPLLIARPERRGLTAGHDFVSLHRYFGGWHRGLVGEVAFATRGDAMLVMDGAAANRFVTSRRHGINVMFPYAAVGYDPSRHPGYLEVPLNSAMGRVLDTTLQSMAAALPELGRHAARDLVHGLCALVRALFHLGSVDDRAEEPVEVARARAMRTWLDGRLMEPHLGIDDVCRAFHASRATVYRLFTEEAGVARYIRRRRLESALQDLLTNTPERGRVRAVAERWGFHDYSHFHRRFREQFGVAPSDAAELCGTSVPLERTIDRASAPSLLRDWLRSR